MEPQQQQQSGYFDRNENNNYNNNNLRHSRNEYIFLESEAEDVEGIKMLIHRKQNQKEKKEKFTERKILYREMKVFFSFIV